MKYLFLMGASGSGKTTLAKKIESIYPDHYRKAIQTTTRPKRANEVEGREYFFLTDKQYDDKSHGLELTAQVQMEFWPYRHGTPKSELQEDKTNIIVASIEGFLDSLEKVEYSDEINILFISDVEPEVERESRDYLQEQKYNQIVVHKVKAIYPVPVKLVEIKHSDLKEIRNDDQAIKDFLRENKL